MKRDARGYRHEFGSLREFTDTFNAGHMMYIDAPSMKKLRADLREFLDDASGQSAGKAGG